MYILYYSPGTASMVVHLTLLELDVGVPGLQPAVEDALLDLGHDLLVRAKSLDGFPPFCVHDSCTPGPVLGRDRMPPHRSS